MQQVCRSSERACSGVTAIMGRSTCCLRRKLLRDALRRGALTVIHLPTAPGRFICCCRSTLSRNRSPSISPRCRDGPRCRLGAAGTSEIEEAAKLIATSKRVAIKAGGGTRGHDAAIRRLVEAAGAAVVLSPGSTGVLPDAHAQNMHVGGSKGSISGNYAMANAEIVLIIGSRAVCQADCSGIGYKSA